MQKGILTPLNELQRKAVTSTEGYVRVIAGAGSGKTKALTHRYAYLVNAAGIRPANILCVTFTNKAAGEMKKRVRELSGDGCDTSLITTYHGFCVRVLREDIGRMFYPENFRILDIGDQKKILEEIYSELDLKLDHASFEKMLALIGKKKASTDYVELMTRRGSDNYYEEIADTDEKIIRRYLLRQKKIFGLDFNDLINFVFVMFERFPEVCEKWQERLLYVQVDEFQDSSDRELKLIDILSEKHKNLFVVGDPDQNIYEWRGAKVGILVDFDKTHPGTQTVIMAQNYRSSARILRVANALIGKNKNRIKKELFTLGGDGAEVIHLHAKNENDESGAIINQIRLLRSDGIKYGDIALLYRASFLSQFLESALMKENIPYELVGSMKFFDRMEILDAIAYMKLVAYRDDASLVRVINTPRRMFGRSKLEKLRSLAAEADLSLYETLLQFRDADDFRRTKVGGLLDLIEGLRRDYKAMRVSDIVAKLLTDSGYETYIRESGNMERFDNLSEFKKMALEHERAYGKLSNDDILPPEHMPLEVFLGEIALMKSDGSQDAATDRVKLMTIHAAKGLEFPAVFVVGLTDGIFPSARTLEERKSAGLEEERRLCFVALTRAKSRLFLTDSEGASQNGSGGYKKTPSRFLCEMGEQNYRRIGEISKDAADAMRSFPSELETPPDKLSVGSRVDHVVFGSGSIIDIDRERGVYMIKFDQNAQIKPISLDYDFGLWKRLMSEQEAETESDAVSDAQENVTVIASDNDASPSENISAQNDAMLTDDEPDTDAEHEDALYLNDIVSDAGKYAENMEAADNNAALIQENKDKAEANSKKEASDVPSYEQLSFDTLLPQNNAAENSIEPDTTQDIDTSENSTSETDDSFSAKKIIAVDNGSDNLWKHDDVPHDGWHCTDVIDLGQPNGVCGMCGYQIIRYVHMMSHPDYPRTIGAGCVCAGRMEGDVERAKRRESDFKNREARMVSFIGHKLKKSRNGNQYFKIGDEIVTIIPDKFRPGHVKAVFRGCFTPSCDDTAQAL
ncbi:MAG: UvrD-helicase domain-containing protein, partial [Eubacteriales bacterium]